MEAVMNKRIYGSLGLAILTVTSSPFAFAAQPWAGLYAGINVGGTWNNQTINQTGSTNFGALSIANAINNGAIPRTIADNPSGALGGFEVNYNYGFKQRYIVGAAVDFDWANAYSNQTVNTTIAGYPAIATSARQALQSLGTIRLLLGYTPSNASILAYVTGGFGYGDEATKAQIIDPGCVYYCGASSNDHLKLGWVIGAGAAYAITPDWAIKAEYLYYSLGSQSQQIRSPAFPGSFLGQNVTYHGNVLRGGIDYKFM
jgi:outer membrane immunogenic protein